MKNIETQEHLSSRARGLLIGIAIGESLGMPVRTLSYNRMVKKYGGEGLSDFLPFGPERDPFRFRAGSIGANTQMMMATCDALPDVVTRSGESIQTQLEPIFLAYKGWHDYQGDANNRREENETIDKVLRETTLDMFRGSDLWTSVPNSDGDTGCLVRTMPFGIMFDKAQAFSLALGTTRITHGDIPTGYMCGVLASIVSGIYSGETLEESIFIALEELKEYPDHEETLGHVMNALKMIDEGANPFMISNQLVKANNGNGETVESVLPSALAWLLTTEKAESDEEFKSLLGKVVYPKGDSHITAAIVGGLTGLTHGEKIIPESWSKEVEHIEVLRALADNLSIN